MSPVTVAGTGADPRRGAGRHRVGPAPQPGRPGRARQLRVVDLDAVRRADLRHARAGAGAVRHGRAGAAARRAVPLRRRAVRLEDRRRAGGLRIGQHLLPTCLAGVNFVLHTAGWLEGGLAMGYEKFVMDADQAGMMHTLLAGVDLSENGQAMDAIREVGPGQTLPRLRTHAGELRVRVLPFAPRRQQQRRAVGSGGRRTWWSERTRSGRRSWRVRTAAARPGGRRGAGDYMTRRKASFADSKF